MEIYHMAKTLVSNSGSKIIIPILNFDIFISQLKLYTPPNNINIIQYGNPLGFSKMTLKQKNDYLNVKLPNNFSWAIITDNDSDVIRKKKSLISHVTSQYACGSCFAICLAHALSDCLVVSGAVSWAPNISETWLLGNLPKGLSNKCYGGNVVQSLVAIETSGVLDSSCIDYSWCETNIKCTEHAVTVNAIETLNELIPTNGCYAATQKFLFKPNKGSTIYHIDSDVDAFTKNVKIHINEFGPTIAGFIVFDNFIHGYHTDPNLPTKGIYFDKCNYNKYESGIVEWGDETNPKHTIGSHGVVVVGWGTEDNVEYATGKRGTVSYWHCRNCWGDKWGIQDGYFKMAMYPFNLMSQIGKHVTSLNSLGGLMIMIKATNYPEIINTKQFDDYKNMKQSKPNAYYNSNPTQVVNISKNGGIVSSNVKSTAENVNYSTGVIGVGNNNAIDSGSGGSEVAIVVQPVSNADDAPGIFDGIKNNISEKFDNSVAAFSEYSTTKKVFVVTGIIFAIIITLIIIIKGTRLLMRKRRNRTLHPYTSHQYGWPSNFYDEPEIELFSRISKKKYE